MKIVYADVLILINFSMDFIALYIVGKLLKLKVSIIRLSLASLLGGFYSLSDFLIKPGPPFLPIFTNICVSIFMCLIAFKGLKNKLVLVCGSFYVICFCLGGGVTAIYSIIGEKWNIISDLNYIYTDISLLEVFCLTVITMIVINIVGKKIKNKAIQKTAKLDIIINNKNISLDAYVDSGCLVKEPISNKDVVFVDEYYLNLLFENYVRLSPEFFIEAGVKICAIPISTISGKDILIGIHPQKISCNEAEIDAIVVFTDAMKFNFYGTKGLISNELVI